MAKRLQHRGGTTSQHSTFTGAVREVTVDTDKNTLVVHDGATAGGHPLATATNFTSTGIDDNATSTAITIDSSQNVSFNDDTGNTEKLVWNATDESLILKVHPTYGDYYIAYEVPRIGSGGVTSDVVLIIGEKDVNEIRITGRFYTPSVPNVNNNRNAFSVDILYQQWNSQLPRFTYDAMHTGSRANTADNMELGEAVYGGKTYYAIKIQANYASLSGIPIYFTGGMTNTTDLGWLPESALTSFTAVTPSSNDSSDKRISAENIRFKNEKNEDKLLITSGGDISFYEDTGTTAKLFWDASTERLGIDTTSPSTALQIGNAVNSNNVITFGKRVATVEGNKPLIGATSSDDYGGNYSSDLGICTTSGTGKIIFYTGNDEAGFGAGSNAERMRVTTSGIVVRGSAVFNEDSEDKDFRVESNNESHMLFVDGGNDRVGIGTSAPQFPLEVNGVTLVNGNLVVTGGTDTADRRAGITHDGSSLIFKASGNSTNRNTIFHRSGDGSADETVRIDSSANTMVGTTIANGDVNNSRNFTAGRFYTRRTFHTFSATNTWETVETLSSNAGTYLLTALGSGGGNPTTDNYIGFVSVNGSGTHIQDIKTATDVQVQMSGLNLQIKQQFFSTANITYSLLKLNN